jgi:glycosyltransferase involved in cell wall biosynthesis
MVAKARRPLLTVIVPVYNEVATLGKLVRRLSAIRIHKEVIAVDDGSIDGSGKALDALFRQGTIRLIRHRHNRGKGAAVRSALAVARGLYSVVQDADLETDPRDIARLLRAARARPGTAVFGTRFPPGRRFPSSARAPLPTRLANLILTRAAGILLGRRLSDVACAYKLLPTSLMRTLSLRSVRFELEAEIAAGIIRRGVPFSEVPVRYRPRGYSEGKKIHPLDGLSILRTLFAARTRYGRQAL